LTAYLRNGWQPEHGVARGPMAQVVGNLSSVPESDVRAIATYMADVFGTPSADQRRRGEEALARVKTPAAMQPPAVTTAADETGAAIYRAACATCHEAGRPLPYGGVNLSLSTAINAPDARNAVNTILTGIRPVPGERSPIMPPFASSMRDDQLVALLRYLRSRFSDRPAWADLGTIVAEARHTQTAALQTSPGPGEVVGSPTQRDKP
jgi:mono/diheme cytochrome c family protein